MVGQDTNSTLAPALLQAAVTCNMANVRGRVLRCVLPGRSSAGGRPRRSTCEAVYYGLYYQAVVPQQGGRDAHHTRPRTTVCTTRLQFRSRLAATHTISGRLLRFVLRSSESARGQPPRTTYVAAYYAGFLIILDLYRLCIGNQPNMWVRQHFA